MLVSGRGRRGLRLIASQILDPAVVTPPDDKWDSQHITIPTAMKELVLHFARS